MLSVGDVVAADEGSSNDVDEREGWRLERPEEEGKEDKARYEREPLRC
jgi:hypothetical protein